MTRGGVERNLMKSRFIVSKIMAGNKIDFYFSSKNHKDKFVKRIKINEINDSLSKRFKINMNLNLTWMIIAYLKIESRGFLIKINGRYAKCPADITLGGEQVTIKS